MLQESIRVLALTPSIVTLEPDLSKVGGVLEGTAANVGYTEAAALPCSGWLPAGLDLQTVGKVSPLLTPHPWLGICDEGAYCTHKSSTSVL